MDLDCISSLVTFEHLNLMCRQAERTPPGDDLDRSTSQTIPALPGRPIEVNRNGAARPYHPVTASRLEDQRTEEALKDDTITCVPFCFQLPRLLPKCSQAKLLFSTFVQGISIHSVSNQFLLIIFINIEKFRLSQSSANPSGTSFHRRMPSMNFCLIFCRGSWASWACEKSCWKRATVASC